jgi:hypothetical protein
MPEPKNIVKRVQAAVSENRVSRETYEEILTDAAAELVDVQGKIVLSAMLTRTALTLIPTDDLLRKAFEVCGLDSERPLHWRVLLDSLVEACFQEGGAPEKWNWERFYDLGQDIQKVWSPDGKLNSSAAVARRLKASKSLKTKYKDFGEPALARLVTRAQDPKFNPAFDFRTDDELQEALTKNLVVSGGQEWTEDTAERIRPFARKMWEKLYQRDLEQRLFSNLVEQYGQNWTEEDKRKNLSVLKDVMRTHDAKTPPTE